MQTILNELYDQYSRFVPNTESLQETVLAQNIQSDWKAPHRFHGYIVCHSRYSGYRWRDIKFVVP